MISVIIPTLNAERQLPEALSALVDGALEGIVRDVVVVDGGSSDETARIADHMGCAIVQAPRGRGPQLAAGPGAAKGDWLLFLHADTVLETGWHAEAAAFCARELADGAPPRAATFRFRLRHDTLTARLLESVVAARCWLMALPYGDQGLLIHRSLYREIGGYADMPLMEDVDIVRRIGRRRLAFLSSRAITSAERYRSSGYLPRVLRNAACLTLYFFGVSPRRIARLYG